MRAGGIIIRASLALLCLSTIYVCEAAGPPRGRRIEFAPPSSTESTNLTQSARKTDGLKEMQSGLMEPLTKAIQPGSLDGVPMPMPLPGNNTAPTKRDRSKELLEMRKSWGMVEEGDLNKEAERKLMGEAHQDQKEEDLHEEMGFSTTDQFLFNMLQADPSLRARKDEDKKSERETEEKERKELSFLKPREQEEGQPAKIDLPSPAPVESAIFSPQKSVVFRDIFAAPTQASRPSAEEEAMRKERLRAYKEIYGAGGGVMTPKEMFESIAGQSTTSPSAPMPSPGNAFANSSPASSPSSPFGAPGGSAQGLGSPIATLPGLGGPAAPLSSLNPPLIPKIEPASRTMPKPTVSFEAPRRPF